MGREVYESFKRFIQEARAVVAAIGGSFLLFVASAVLDHFQIDVLSGFSASLAVLVFLFGSFWAYHLLRLRNEAGFIDRRLEKLGEYPHVWKSHGDRLLDADSTEFRPRIEIPVGTLIRALFSAPVYDESVFYFLPEPGRQIGQTVGRPVRDVHSIQIMVKREPIPKGSKLVVRVAGPAPIRLRSIRLTMPPEDPPSTKAPE